MLPNAHHRMRLVAAALPLVLISSLAWAGHKVQRVEKKTVKVDGETVVIVNNARGKTIVIGEPGAKQVTIVASMLVHAKDADAAGRAMEALRFDVEKKDNKIVIISKLPRTEKGGHSFWSVVKGDKYGALIDFTIEVPRDFDVETATTSGDVQVSGVTGTARVIATSGDVLLREIGSGSTVELTSGAIEASEIGGDLRIAATSGNARITRVKGLLQVQTTSGNVTAVEVGGDAMVQLVTGDVDLEGCLGNVSISTASGNARIVGVLGSVNATSSSGDLDVVIIPVGDKEFYLNTATGDVKVFFLPDQDYGFLLDVNTCTGAIYGDMELTKLDQVSRRKLKGVVGNGKSRVIIETASGNVSIVERTEKHEKHD